MGAPYIKVTATNHSKLTSTWADPLETFREYVWSLSLHSIGKACDMLDWCWTQEDKDGVVRIRCSMNIAILMNSGWSDETKTNVGPKDGGDWDSRFYALRDIKEGEEILMDYNIYETDWGGAGLGEMRETALKKWLSGKVGLDQIRRELQRKEEGGGERPPKATSEL